MPLVMLPLFAAAVYLGLWRAGARRRNARSWESLLGCLRPTWGNRDCSLWREGLNATAEDAWRRIDGANGLCAMYQNAGVMLEMAHYAMRHGGATDRGLVESLARDAMHIRVYVLIALGQYALGRATESVRSYAYHAATTYAEMAARTVELLQVEAAGIVPDFVAAM